MTFLLRYASTRRWIRAKPHHRFLLEFRFEPVFFFGSARKRPDRLKPTLQRGAFACVLLEFPLEPASDPVLESYDDAFPRPASAVSLGCRNW
jgi:hypothetical protein